MISPRQLLYQSFFIYYCSTCITPLATAATPLTSGYLTRKIGRCPRCSQPFEDPLSYKQTYAPAPPSGDAHVLTPSEQESDPPTDFQTASSLLGLTSGIRRVDSIIGGLKERTHLHILGRLCNILAERLCVRALLPKDKGGLDTNPIFIDGGNCSDPYLFAAYARRYRIEPKKALQRVLTSRAFTIHQLADLLIRELPQILGQSESRLVILADILSMFNDPQVDQQESKRIVEEIGRSIERMKDEVETVVISTTSRKSGLTELLLKGADTVIELEPAKNHSTALSLLKHPRHLTSSSAFQEGELFRVKTPHPQYTTKEVAAYG